MESYDKIIRKDHLNIIVIDSGLGGLSVQSLLDNKLRSINLKTSVNLIFYNAVVHHDRGYNTMTEYSEKIETFDKALFGTLKFEPDLILIACNTLSVLLNDTNFNKECNIPVLGIIDAAIELVIQAVDNVNSLIVLFGTETTINSNAHRNSLIANKYDGQNIIPQKCKNLESEIQENPDSELVDKMIADFVSQAKEKSLEDYNKVYGLLCCTHYGFVEEKFKDALKLKFECPVEILNPNKQMAETALEHIKDQNTITRINNYVISKVDIREGETQSLSKIISTQSQDLTHALKNYFHDEYLF